MTGTIVTFYSYKGGVGRTFALANTAAVLARWGYRTLCIDWDLDAPGLAFYLREWLATEPPTGLVDLVDQVVSGCDPDPGDHVVPVALPGTDGRLDLLAAGSTDARYVRQAQDLNWETLYAQHDLGAFLERWRAAWKERYDVVLVDSRTGITDIGGICTTQLPDVLVMLFTANEQSLRGTLDIARRAEIAHNGLPYDRGGLQIVPVLSRFDSRPEYKRAEEWQQRVAVEVGHLLGNWAYREAPVERLLALLTIPYVTYWSFGEELPALAEPGPDPEKIGYSLETLAALVANRLGRTDLLAESRDSYVAIAARGGLRERTAGYDVFVSCARPDFEVAEAIARELVNRSLRVFLPSADVTVGEAWQEVTVEALVNSTHLVAVVGKRVDHSRIGDVERFVRQTLDEGTPRLVIPVLLPDVARKLPGILSQFQAERLHDMSSASIATLAIRIARAVSVAGTRPGEGRAAAVLADVFDLLSEVIDWQLDILRWQLVDDGISLLENALDTGDDDLVGVAVADIELLGPVRGSGLGHREVVGVPDAVRNRIYHLIARLSG